MTQHDQTVWQEFKAEISGTAQTEEKIEAPKADAAKEAEAPEADAAKEAVEPPAAFDHW